MGSSLVDIGVTPNDGKGAPLRQAVQTFNGNFAGLDALVAALQSAAAVSFTVTGAGQMVVTYGDGTTQTIATGLIRASDVAAGYQPLDLDLTAIAALTTAAFGRSLLTGADAPGVRTLLGLGAAALLNAGVAGGAATLDPSTGKLLAAQIPDALLGSVRYQGGWNASTNSPALPTPSAANRGWYYIVTTAGTTGQPGPAGTISDWQVGDWAVSDGSFWEKVDSSDQVLMVAGLQGNITAAALKTALALVAADITDATTAGQAMLKAASVAAQTALLSAFTGDAGTGGLKGLVPAPGAGDAAAFKVLRADGTFGLVQAVAASVITYAMLAGGAVGAASDLFANTASKLVSVNALWAAQAPVALGSISGTYTLDFNTLLRGTATVSANLTMANPANVKAGQTGSILFTMGAASLTISYGTAWKPTAAPGTTPAAPTAPTTSGALCLLSWEAYSATQIVYSLVNVGA